MCGARGGDRVVETAFAVVAVVVEERGSLLLLLLLKDKEDKRLPRTRLWGVYDRTVIWLDVWVWGVWGVCLGFGGLVGVGVV